MKAEFFKNGLGWHYRWGASTCGPFRTKAQAQESWAQRQKDALD